MQTVAAHVGTYGARIATLETQYAYFSTALVSPLTDSLTTLLDQGRQRLAGRDRRPGARQLVRPRHVVTRLRRHAPRVPLLPVQELGQHGDLHRQQLRRSGRLDQVQIEYKADQVGGGAQLYVNGTTQNRWGVNGNYSRTANLQRIQLWNEGLTNNDYDDVTVQTVPPPGVSPPGAPTA